MALTSDIHAYGGRPTHSHIPGQPLWVGILRIVQALFALITLALSAYAISALGSYGGYGLNIFTSILTWIFLVYIFLTAYLFPLAFSVWAQLALEIALVIFWLSTWATLAALASWWSIGWRFSSRGSAAVGCTQAAAALGAFTWVTFVATLVYLSIALYRHRKAGLSTVPGRAAATPTTTEHKMEPVPSAQPVGPEYPQQAYPQQEYPQPYQQPYQQTPYAQQQTV